MKVELYESGNEWVLRFQAEHTETQDDPQLKNFNQFLKREIGQQFVIDPVLFRSYRGGSEVSAYWAMRRLSDPRNPAPSPGAQAAKNSPTITSLRVIQAVLLAGMCFGFGIAALAGQDVFSTNIRVIHCAIASLSGFLSLETIWRILQDAH